jgi:hypothetical protein
MIGLSKGLALLVTATCLLGPARLESPGGDECFEWAYPKNDACGALSGKTECKARPTIEASDDEKKKADCQPTKGDDCFCE